MVVHMNLHHQRGRFLEKGIFQSKEMGVNFLAGFSTGRYWSGANDEVDEDDNDEVDDEDDNVDDDDEDDEDDEAKRLNAIWYTLRDDPDFIKPGSKCYFFMKECMKIAYSIQFNLLAEHCLFLSCMSIQHKPVGHLLVQTKQHALHLRAARN
jgi:hypothetical protein